MLRLAGGGLAIAGAGLMALTGRFIAALPLALFGLMLLMRGSGRRTSKPGAGPTGRVSTARSAFFEMTLEHDSGEMRGRVLTGAFAGRELASLDGEDLLLLWRECRAADPPGRQLLEAYLDRNWPEWRDAQKQPRDGEPRADRSSAEGEARAREQRPPPSDGMSVEEALAFLGLGRGATVDEVKSAHRQLMKQVHPDVGGNAYLAAKINEAKEVLLTRGTGATRPA
jgi:hypothetical protein